MAHPQVADRDSLQIWKAAVNILNDQLQMRGSTTAPYENLHTPLDFDSLK